MVKTASEGERPLNFIQYPSLPFILRFKSSVTGIGNVIQSFQEKSNGTLRKFI